MRDNSEILLQSVAVINGIFDPERHILSDLPDLYKDRIASLDAKGIIAFIKELHEYADIYRNTIPEFDSSNLFSYEDALKRMFHILDVCEISTFHPYIMFLMKNYKDNSEKRNARLLSLETFIVRRMITGAEVKSYNRLCKEFITSQDVDSRVAEITKDGMLAGLEFINNKNAALLLFWIELFRRYRDSKQSIKELKYNYSLEHLMPQKWEDYWANVPIVEDDGNQIKDGNLAKSQRYRRIYAIGNMTLLNSRLNTSLRNYTFDRKIEGEGKKKGIRHYSELSITKDDILSQYDAGNVTWNEKSIWDRTVALCDEIMDMWK